MARRSCRLALRPLVPARPRDRRSLERGRDDGAALRAAGLGRADGHRAHPHPALRPGHRGDLPPRGAAGTGVDEHAVVGAAPVEIGADQAARGRLQPVALPHRRPGGRRTAAVDHPVRAARHRRPGPSDRGQAPRACGAGRVHPARQAHISPAGGAAGARPAAAPGRRRVRPARRTGRPRRGPPRHPARPQVDTARSPSAAHECRTPPGAPGDPARGALGAPGCHRDRGLTRLEPAGAGHRQGRIGRAAAGDAPSAAPGGPGRGTRQARPRRPPRTRAAARDVRVQRRRPRPGPPRPTPSRSRRVRRPLPVGHARIPAGPVAIRCRPVAHPAQLRAALGVGTMPTAARELGETGRIDRTAQAAHRPLPASAARRRPADLRVRESCAAAAGHLPGTRRPEASGRHLHRRDTLRVRRGQGRRWENGTRPGAGDRVGARRRGFDVRRPAPRLLAARRDVPRARPPDAEDRADRPQRSRAFPEVELVESDRRAPWAGPARCRRGGHRRLRLHPRLGRCRRSPRADHPHIGPGRAGRRQPGRLPGRPPRGPDHPLPRKGPALRSRLPGSGTGRRGRPAGRGHEIVVADGVSHLPSRRVRSRPQSTGPARRQPCHPRLPRPAGRRLQQPGRHGQRPDRVGVPGRERTHRPAPDRAHRAGPTAGGALTPGHARGATACPSGCTSTS